GLRKTDPFHLDFSRLPPHRGSLQFSALLEIVFTISFEALRALDAELLPLSGGKPLCGPHGGLPRMVGHWRFGVCRGGAAWERGPSRTTPSCGSGHKPTTPRRAGAAPLNYLSRSTFAV